MADLHNPDMESEEKGRESGQAQDTASAESQEQTKNLDEESL